MIQFADSHVDLMGSVTFTSAQLIRRWGQELLKKWRIEVQNNLRDFMQMKPALDPETFPNYAANDAMLAEFIADKQTCYTRMMADMQKNQLLIDVLAYEAAVQRKAELELLINGREAVAEVLDEFDQVVSPAVDAVEPMDAESDGYVTTVAELETCEAVINNASMATLELAAERNP